MAISFFVMTLTMLAADNPASAVFPENCNDTRLLGEWRIYYVEYDGGGRSVAPWVWTIGPKNYRILVEGVERDYSYEIDRSVTPLRMTITYTGKDPELKKLLVKPIKCIYKFDDEKLIRCLAIGSDTFPSSFSTTQGDDVELQVFVRNTSSE